MNQKTTITLGALLAALAVMIGAFGAHALRKTLEELGRTETFELAVRYQFYHAFAILFVGMFMDKFKSKHLGYSALSFIAGTAFFSGSLYVLSLTGTRWLGAITPLGGVLFILGWAFMIAGVQKK